MKDWGHQDSVFETWTEAQKQLWERLSKALPVLKSVAGEGMWQQVYEKNLDTWESAIKQILELQTKSLDQWIKREEDKGETPEFVNEWSRHVNEIMQAWIEVQSQVWEDWFQALRAAGEKASERLPTKPAEPAQSKKPTANVIVAQPTESPPSKSAESRPAEAPTEPQEKPSAAPPTVEAGAPQTDDLQVLTGLGPVIEKKLNEHGVFNYRQLAELRDEDIENIETNILKSGNRFSRYDWINQAKELHLKKYGEKI